MKLRSMRVVSVSALVIGALFIAEASQAVAEGYLASEESTMVSLVNQHRAAVGLPSLRSDAGLQMVARRQTSRMVAAGYIYHNPNLGAEAGAAVPGWLKIGENVGVGPDTPTVEDAFLASPHHRENIEDNAYNLIGLGAMSGTNSVMYFTQNFAAQGGSRAVAPNPPAAPAAPAARPAVPPTTPRPARTPAPPPAPAAPRPTTPKPTTPASTAPVRPATTAAPAPTTTAEQPATTTTEQPTTTTTPTPASPDNGTPLTAEAAGIVHLVPVDTSKDAQAKRLRSRVGMWRTIGAVLSRVARKLIP